MRVFKTVLTTASLCVAMSTPAWAGPIIIAGTDADDHGTVSGGVNVNGWEFMQRAFENLAPAVSNGQTNVVCLGCNSSTALSAFNSAINLSSIAGTWNESSITAAGEITTFLAGGTVGGRNLANTGIIYMNSGFANVSGGMTNAQMTEINTGAVALNNFVIGGGGLFTQSQSSNVGGYGWLQALIPGLIVNPGQRTPLQLTAAGMAAFPGLTNTDMANATPWHNWFSGNFGSLQVLAVGAGDSATLDDAVVLGGGAAGAIICGTPGAPACPPDPAAVPEPGSMLLLGTGLMGLVRYARRKTAQ